MTTPTTTQLADGPPSAPPTRSSGVRTPLRVLVVGLSVLLVAWGAVSVASLLARATEHRSGTFSGVRLVDVDTAFEHVTVIGSDDTTSVRMTRSYSWSLQKPTVSAEVASGRLAVTSSCPWAVGLGCSGSITLVVPRGQAVRVDSSDGHVTLRGLAGRVDASTSDGGIDATGLTGRLTLHSSDGSIDATGLRSATVDAHTSDGSVALTFVTAPARVTASSSDGSVEVGLPHAGAPYRVDATTSDGSRTVDVATDPEGLRRVEVHTSDGSLRVVYSD